MKQRLQKKINLILLSDGVLAINRRIMQLNGDRESYFFVKSVSNSNVMFRLSQSHYDVLCSIGFIDDNSKELLIDLRRLDQALFNLKNQGLLPGWRNESFACWGDRAGPWPYPDEPYFICERSGFRYLAIRSLGCLIT